LSLEETIGCVLDLNRVGWGRGGKWLGELPRDQWQGDGRMARRRKARGKGKVDNSGTCWEIEWPGMIRPEQWFWGLRDTLKSWLLKGESIFHVTPFYLPRSSN